MAVTYRTTGAWGAGKGAKLTPVEVDTNFYELVQQINDILSNPVQPVEIEDIIVSGNQMTVLMSDASTYGPFTLPTAEFNWTGDFIPNATYEANDMVLANDALYLVINDHTAGPTFVATADYAFLMPLPRVFDIGGFIPQKPGYGLPAAAALFSYRGTRAWYLEEDAPSSIAVLGVDPAAELVMAIHKNTTPIGTITFAAGSTTGVIAVDASTFDAGDALRVIVPDAVDADAVDLNFTFAARIGEP